MYNNEQAVLADLTGKALCGLLASRQTGAMDQEGTAKFYAKFAVLCAEKTLEELKKKGNDDPK
jgi:hypothetical protein